MKERKDFYFVVKSKQDVKYDGRQEDIWTSEN